MTFGEVVMSGSVSRVACVGKEGRLLKGKVVIDTNPSPTRRRNGNGTGKRRGTAAAELLPGACLVRAFNAIPQKKMGAGRVQETGKRHADRERVQSRRMHTSDTGCRL